MYSWDNWRDYVDKIGGFGDGFPIIPVSTVLVLVDLQYAYASPDHGLGLQCKTKTPSLWHDWSRRITQQVIPNNKRLLDFFRKHGLHIIHVHRGFMLPDAADELPLVRRRFHRIEVSTGHKAPWWNPIGSIEQQPLPSVAPIEGEIVLTKRSYSAFATTGLDGILRHLAADTVIISGVSTSACVENTARAAMDLSYNVVLVDDACAETNPLFHDVTMIIFSVAFGRVLTTNELLSELSSELHLEE